MDTLFPSGKSINLHTDYRLPIGQTQFNISVACGNSAANIADAVPLQAVPLAAVPTLSWPQECGLQKQNLKWFLMKMSDALSVRVRVCVCVCVILMWRALIQ